MGAGRVRGRRRRRHRPAHAHPPSLRGGRYPRPDPVARPPAGTLSPSRRIAAQYPPPLDDSPVASTFLRAGGGLAATGLHVLVPPRLFRLAVVSHARRQSTSVRSGVWPTIAAIRCCRSGGSPPKSARTGGRDQFSLQLVEPHLPKAGSDQRGGDNKPGGAVGQVDPWPPAIPSTCRADSATRSFIEESEA